MCVRACCAGSLVLCVFAVAHFGGRDGAEVVAT